MAASTREKQKGTGEHTDRMPAEPDPSVVAEAKSKLDFQVNTNKSAAGLAIVVGNTGPAGVEIDIERMEKAFQKLNFVVIPLLNPTMDNLVALLRAAAKHQYPEGFFRFIALYFAGHGGSVDGHAFIYPSKTVTSPLFVEEGIMREFYPENTPSLGNRTRLFFFDSCLKDDTTKGPGDASAQFDESSDALLPARGNILVAYATSLTFGSRGNKHEGGYWTRHLHHNLVNLDLSLSTVLDITWEETVIETAKKNKGDLHKTQGPHYISCLGLVYLKHPNWSREFALEHSKRADGVTTNVDSATANVNGVTANVEEMNAVKHSQETAVVANGGQEMRALGTGDDQDDLRWRKRDSGDSDSEDENSERYAPPVDQLDAHFDAPMVAAWVEPSSRAARLLCTKPSAKDVAAKIKRHSLKWKLIGQALQLDTCFLDEVETNRLPPLDSLDRVIVKWIACSEATWEHLLQAMLANQELHCVAECFVKFLNSDYCFDKYEKQASL